MTVPIGTILPYGGLVDGNARGELARQGWLVCDGEEYSESDYQELENTIGVYYGRPSRAGMFKVPDLRGRFLRGVDDGTQRDPDAASRTASAPGGNTGDRVGSLQEDENKSHKHEYFDESQRIIQLNELSLVRQKLEADPNYKADSVVEDPPDMPLTVQLTAGQLAGLNNLIDRYAKRDTSTNDGKETRPKNIYVNWIIKAKNV